MRRSSLGLIAVSPIVLIISYQFMVVALKQDWSRTGQNYMLLFLVLPIFSFVLLRFEKGMAKDSIFLMTIIASGFGALALLSLSTIKVAYDDQAMIPAIAILIIAAVTSFASLAHAFLAKPWGSWRATKPIFIIAYLASFISIFSLLGGSTNGAMVLLATFSVGIGFILDLVYEMRIRSGRGILNTVEQGLVASILAFLLISPLLWIMIVPFGAY